jgi:hypothetical protein
MAFLDELSQWTDRDAAALALGKALGLFSAATTVGDVKALLYTNDAVGNTLYGLLERLAWLGTLDRDHESNGDGNGEGNGNGNGNGAGAERYKAAPSRLHPLGAAPDVPALEAGPPARAHIAMSVDAGDSFRLEADRAGFRFLARVFEEIAASSLEPGWQADRDAAFQPAAARPLFSCRLVDPRE